MIVRLARRHRSANGVDIAGRPSYPPLTAAMNSGDGMGIDAMRQLKHEAVEMWSAVLCGMAKALAPPCGAKTRTAAGVGESLIERLYGVAIEMGARASKVASGGGFMRFLTAPQHHPRLDIALEASGGQADVIALTHAGATSWIAT